MPKLTLMPNSGMFCVVKTPTVATHAYVFPVVARDEAGMLWIEKEFTTIAGDKTVTWEPLRFKPYDRFAGKVLLTTAAELEGMFTEPEWARAESGYTEAYINYTAIFISEDDN